MVRPYGMLSLMVLAVALAAGVHQVGATDPVGRWRPLIEQAAARHGVPADLVVAIVAVESGGNARAVGTAGERGLMQLLPSTARALGVQEAFDPVANLDGGARYLAAELRACGGDVACAVAGYNGGPGARTQPLPSTRRYVAAVLARRATPAVVGVPDVRATTAPYRSRLGVRPREE